jgi:maleate isomerase
MIDAGRSSQSTARRSSRQDRGRSETAQRPTIGVVLPSSNRTVERVAHAIRQDRPELDICMTRVPYDGHPSDGYELDSFRRATRLLSDSRPDVILWNATRGALLGFEPDRTLCRMIEEIAGVPATTTALATLQVLKASGIRRIALIAQGGLDDCERLAGTFGDEGIAIIASVALGISDNFDAAAVTDDDLIAAAGDLCARAEPEGLLIWSTNLGGHALSRRCAGLGVPVFDSTTIGFDVALGLLDDPPRNKPPDAALSPASPR